MERRQRRIRRPRGLRPATVLPAKEWPYAVIELYLGRQQPDTTLGMAGKEVERCQAQFYIGEWDLLLHRVADQMSAHGGFR